VPVLAHGEGTGSRFRERYPRSSVCEQGARLREQRIHKFFRIERQQISSLLSDADDVNLSRNPNRHLSFGVGIHRCVGSHLARIEFAEVVTAVLTRLPDFEIDEDAVVEYPNWASIGGWAKLPPTFTPGPRLSGGK